MAIDKAMLDRTVPDPETEEQAREEIDVDKDLADTLFYMGIDLMKEGGVLPTLDEAMNTSSDPAQVVGQFLTQLIAQLAEVASEEFNFDPRVFLARDGWLTRTLDFIEDELGLPEEFSDEVYDVVLEMIKGLAQGEKQPAAPAQPGIDQMQGQAPAEAGPPQGMPADPNAGGSPF